MEEELDNFRQRIERHQADLTNSQQRIASYLLANHESRLFVCGRSG